MPACEVELPAAVGGLVPTLCAAGLSVTAADSSDYELASSTVDRDAAGDAPRRPTLQATGVCLANAVVQPCVMGDSDQPCAASSTDTAPLTDHRAILERLHAVSMNLLL